MVEVAISTNSKAAEDYVSSIQRRMHDMGLLLIEEKMKNKAMKAVMNEIFMCPHDIIGLIGVEFKEMG